VEEVRTNKPNLAIGIGRLFARMELVSIPMEAQGYPDRAK
jgi:hypothetical protein